MYYINHTKNYFYLNESFFFAFKKRNTPYDNEIRGLLPGANDKSEQTRNSESTLLLTPFSTVAEMFVPNRYWLHDVTIWPQVN